MAWLQQLPSGKFHISFRFGGRKYKRSLYISDARRAKSHKVRLEDTIRLIENGMAEFPAGVDVASFLTTDGKEVGKAVAKECHKVFSRRSERIGFNRIAEPITDRQDRTTSA